MINSSCNRSHNGNPAAHLRCLVIRLAWLSVTFVPITSVPITSAAWAQDRGPEPGALRIHESDHFVVCSDATAEEVAGVIQRMEASLQFAIRCWGREPGEKIDCFLVRDLNNWPSRSLPHPLARIYVGHVGGATLDRVRTEQGTHGQRVVIYASLTSGVAEHEAMHAYCSVVFGTSGPEWFREGMAEMAAYGEDTACGVRCPTERLSPLRQVQVRPIQDIRTVGKSTKRLTESLANMMSRRVQGEHHVALDAWSERDGHALREARHEYLWSWALCHMLYHNPNYSERFRMLGQCYLSRQRTTFEQVFAPMMREMMFEYSQFVRDAQVGYRADLCRWEWNQRFTSLDVAPSVTAQCAANRGWQATGVTVAKDQSYNFVCRGNWSTGNGQPPTDANGRPDGTGRLVAVVMRDYQLSEPFPLGARGTFTVPMGGKLYLRCRDSWSELGDNSGTQVVQLSRVVKQPAGVQQSGIPSAPTHREQLAESTPSEAAENARGEQVATD